MKPLLWTLASLSLLLVGAGVGLGMRLNHNAAAAPGPPHQTHEVAILFCATTFGPAAPSIVVRAYEATADAPLIPVGTSCATALKTLLDADFGFEPTQVRPSAAAGDYEYTLIKTPGLTPTPEPTPRGLTSIRGSGTVTSEPREVSGFTAVSLSGSGHLILEQTGTEALTITAEDNILPYLTSEVRGTQLILGPKSNTSLQPTEEITYRLTVKSLAALEVTGSGRVEAQGINAERLQITVRGAGDLTMAGQAERQEIRLAGAGNYRGEDLKSQAVTIDIAGSGRAVLAVSDTLEANISGVGSVEYLGDPVVRQHVSGLGSVRKR